MYKKRSVYMLAKYIDEGYVSAASNRAENIHRDFFVWLGSARGCFIGPNRNVREKKCARARGREKTRKGIPRTTLASPSRRASPQSEFSKCDAVTYSYSHHSNIILAVTNRNTKNHRGVFTQHENKCKKKENYNYCKKKNKRKIQTDNKIQLSIRKNTFFRLSGNVRSRIFNAQ